MFYQYNLMATLFLFVIFLMLFNNAQSQKLNSLPKPVHQFIVVAHRGDHTHAPENTMEAIKNAINAGVDYVEIDLRTTADSSLIIMHDASVDRMTNGKGLIKDLTAEQIKNLKVKEKGHSEWGEFNIPFFEEVLRLCRNKIYIYLDFKNANPEAAYKLIVQFQMEKQVIVYINNQEQFYQWRKAAPQMPLMISLPENIKDTNSLKAFLTRINPEILDGDFKQYTKEMVTAAEEQGYLVLPDIQGNNEQALWDIALQKGVHGLQTDDPEALINYLLIKKIR